MNKQTEALKQALEALDFIPQSGSMLGAQAEIKRLQSITALREALVEQPAQGCDHCNHALYAGTKCKNCGRVTEQAAIKRDLTPEQPAQQEPVAFLVDGDLYYPEEIDWETLQEQGHTVAPLYTSTQRTWVGLTDEDVRQCSRNVVAGGPENSVDRFAYAIEAKLKEKNT